MTPHPHPMSWLRIVVVLAITAVIAGVTLGLLRDALGLSGGMATAGVGAATGVVGALLVTRRRAAVRHHD